MDERRTHLRASLLDRLVGGRPEAAGAEGRAHRPAGLYEAVRQDLERLLSTRRGTPPPERGGPAARRVHDYGVQDFLHLSPRSEADRRQMAAAIARAVEAFEPRLTQVRVEVEGFTDEEIRAHPERVEMVRLRIDGLLRGEAVQEPVSFPFVVRR